MDQLPKTIHVKNEISDSTSTCKIEIPNGKQMNLIKKESDSLAHSEIRIKTELQEDHSESPIVAVTCYELCPSYHVKNEIIEDHLDISGVANKEQIFLGNHFLDTEKNSDSFGSRSNNKEPEDDFKNKIEVSKVEKKVLLTNNKKNFDTSNNDGSKIKKQRRKINHEPDNATCHICQKIFSHKGNLNKHLRSHTGEKPFLCDICQKSFAQKDALVTHTLIHTDEKPFSCDICSKLCRQKADLNKHKLIHSGEKPYPCSECNRTFRQKQHLVRHKRTKHKQ